MPSPIGHALAGVAAAWSADLLPGVSPSAAPQARSWYERAGGRLTVICAILAAAPDLDLLFPGAHRGPTHSVTAAVIVGLAAWALAKRGRASFPSPSGATAARIGLVCGAAWGTHLLLDWLSADTFYPYGIELFWPFSHQWFISSVHVFAETERRALLSRTTITRDAWTAAREIAILLPVVIAVWLVRVKALARLAPELPRCDHAPQ